MKEHIRMETLDGWHCLVFGPYVLRRVARVGNRVSIRPRNWLRAC